MSARAWRARKPGGPGKEERAWIKAQRRAQRNPGQMVHVSGTYYSMIYDEVIDIPLNEWVELPPLKPGDSLVCYSDGTATVQNKQSHLEEKSDG